MNQTEPILREALQFYQEQARLARLIHSEGDKGRHALALDGGERAKKALAAEPAKLVSLTDEKIEEIGRKILDRGYQWEGLQPWVYVFAKAIINEMKHLNQ